MTKMWKWFWGVVLTIQPAIWTPVILTLNSSQNHLPNSIIPTTANQNNLIPPIKKAGQDVKADEQISDSSSQKVKADKHQNLVDQLQLTKLTRLSTLTSEQLTERLKDANKGNNQPFQVQILAESSELQGILKLKFTNDNNHNLVEDDDGITTVSGFQTYNGKTFFLQNLQVDLDYWVQNHLPIKENDSHQPDLTAINKLPLKQLIAQGDFYLNDDNIVEKLSFKQLFTNFPDAEISGSLIFDNKTNSHKLNLNPLEIPLKEYEEKNGWVDLVQTRLQKDSTKQQNFNFPTWQDFLQHIIQKVQLSNNDLTKHYPSYFFAKKQYSQNNSHDLTALADFFNWNELSEKYKQFYFPNKEIYLTIDFENGFFADDYQGTLSFNLLLKEGGENTSQTKPPRKKIELQMKAITNWIKTQQSQTNTFTIAPNLKAHSKILAELKKAANKTIIEKLFQSSNPNPVTIQVSKNIFRPQGLANYFFNSEYNDNKQEQYNNLIEQWYGELSLFNKPLKTNPTPKEDVCRLQNSDELAHAKNLYICNSDGHTKNQNAFAIKSLNYQFTTNHQQQVSLTLSKVNNLINITFAGHAIVEFINKNNSTEQFPTKFSLIITKTQFQSFDPKPKNHPI